MANASARGEKIRNAFLPRRSDAKPTNQDEIHQDVAITPNKFATAGKDTCKSWAISGRKGARVLPVLVAANMPRQEAATMAQGMDTGLDMSGNGGRRCNSTITRMISC